MKKALSTLFFAAIMMIGGAAQAQKIGHIAVDQLVSLMPETEAAKKEIETFGQSLQKDLSDMEAELNSLYTQYRQNEAMMTELRRESEQKKIQDLQSRIQEYAVRAQELMENKRVEVLTPVLQKAQDAIDAVAKEKGFLYILDASQSKGVVVYAGGEDVMPLVKAKLGIK